MIRLINRVWFGLGLPEIIRPRRLTITELRDLTQKRITARIRQELAELTQMVERPL